MKLWRLTIENGRLCGVREDGCASIDVEVPGHLVDYVGQGVIVRADVQNGLLVIMEKVNDLTAHPN